jgi:L-lactate dehydrogenase complex protein LldG
MSPSSPPASCETGDRTAFLGRLRRQLANGVPVNLAHPLPAPVDSVPVPRSSLLDDRDLVGSFERNATEARAVVHRLGDTVPDSFVAELIERHRVRRAVVSNEPEAQAVGARLAALGVEVSPVSIEASANADLGVTGAIAALATTGSLVQSAGTTGGRTASLLPPVHLCVLPASRIVASTSDVLRGLGAPGRLPSNLVFITGPSRSGDIELIIALGVHGPLVVEVALLTTC